MPQLRVLLIGDHARSEMFPVRNWLTSRTDAAEVRQTLELPLAGDEVIHEWLPDLVIVCQSWPDEFPAHDVADSLGHWPLAMWVVCYGAWCQSDGRTRTNWPIGLRVPVQSAADRLNHLWSILLGECRDPLPITASRDEAFEFDLSAAPLIPSC